MAMDSVADEAAVRRIIVSTAMQGKGVGSTLLDHGLAWAVQRGAKKVFLEVREDNDTAIRFYERAGFFLVNRRRDYYGGTHDALIYRWNAPEDQEEP